MTASRRATLVALAGLTLSGAAVSTAGPVQATTASATATKVALLVQTAPGTVKTYCVTYRAGITGAAVLAVASPTYGTGPYTGFVVKIGGVGRTPPTATTYWAYWRSPAGAGTYAYSSTGVASSRPAAGSVEAWVYYPGAVATFPHRTYAKICPNGHT